MLKLSKDMRFVKLQAICYTDFISVGHIWGPKCGDLPSMGPSENLPWNDFTLQVYLENAKNSLDAEGQHHYNTFYTFAQNVIKVATYARWQHCVPSQNCDVMADRRAFFITVVKNRQRATAIAPIDPVLCS